MGRKSLRGLARLLPALLVCAVAAPANAAITPAPDSSAFLEPGVPAVLNFACEQSKSGTRHGYVVSDYCGRAVSHGDAVERDRQIDVPVTLDAGYYEIAFQPAGEVFGLLAVPRFQGPADPFFGLDAALSWLAPPALRPRLIDTLARVGVGMARERLTWPRINPAPDKWDWETPAEFDKTRKAYAARGVQVLELFHEAPVWTGAKKDGDLPTDLAATARAWTVIGRHWAPAWGAVEIWNEPDASISGDQYAPLVKAVRYGLRRAGVGAPLGCGAVAYLNRPFLDSAARNGLLEEADFVSFHYYGKPLDLQKYIAGFRDWLQAFGKPEMPLWITEIGGPWEGDPNQRPTPDKDAARALDFAANAVEARACGIARMFPFVYVNYSEKGTRNYGMLDAAGTPLRTMAAYAQAIRALSHRAYMGDLRISDPQVQRARVFEDADGQALVVINTGRVDPGATVSLPFKIGRATGADGRLLGSGGDAKLPIPDGVAYVEADRAEVAALLDTGSAAMRLARLGRSPAPAPPEPSAVVLQLVPDAAKFTSDPRGYSTANGLQTLPFHLRATNLADHEIDLRVRLGSGAGPVRGPGSLLDTSLAVPANRVIGKAFNIPLEAAAPDGDGTLVIEAAAASTRGERIGPAAVTVLLPRTLEEHLKGKSYHFALPIGELARWQTNITPAGRMQMSRTREGGWILTATFHGGDRWVYPKCAVPVEANFARVDGVLLRARCQKPAVVRIIAGTVGGEEYTTAFPVIAADGKWHVALVPLSSFIPQQAAGDADRRWKTVSIGLNSQTNENRLEVSDLYLVGN